MSEEIKISEAAMMAASQITGTNINGVANETHGKIIQLAINEATRPLVEALSNLIEECNYSVSSNIPFKNGWTQFNNAIVALAAHRKEHGQ